WNLSPLDERWEAIEDAERLFRGSPIRISTDNIGLAETDGGLTLVRIGPAPRPELATWRYGRVLRSHFARTSPGRAALRAAAAVSRLAGRDVSRLVRRVGLPAPGYDAITWLRIHLFPERVL